MLILFANFDWQISSLFAMANTLNNNTYENKNPAEVVHLMTIYKILCKKTEAKASLPNASGRLACYWPKPAILHPWKSFENLNSSKWKLNTNARR